MEVGRSNIFARDKGDVESNSGALCLHTGQIDSGKMSFTINQQPVGPCTVLYYLISRISARSEEVLSGSHLHYNKAGLEWSRYTVNSIGVSLCAAVWVDWGRSAWADDTISDR
ncbi:hypothetical protein J6590_061085 [Homalodisca vitripennis]|nr:hypothetical protein J6590_061085 [Homalodisca vitripennis]